MRAPLGSRSIPYEPSSVTTCCRRDGPSRAWREGKRQRVTIEKQIDKAQPLEGSQPTHCTRYGPSRRSDPTIRHVARRASTGTARIAEDDSALRTGRPLETVREEGGAPIHFLTQCPQLFARAE